MSEKGPGLIFAELVVVSHELLHNVGRDFVSWSDRMKGNKL